MYEFIPPPSRISRGLAAGTKDGFKSFSRDSIPRESVGEFIDAHTHIQFSAYDEDRSDVIERARKEKIAIVNIGTQKDTSRRAVEIAYEFSAKNGLTSERGSGIFATVGLHPIHTSKSFHDAQELGEPFANFRQRRTSAPACLWKELTNGDEGVGGFVGRGEEFDYNYYKGLALDKKVVAIGECGLDYFHLQENIPDAKERQKKAFIEQIKLSRDVKKPLMIHCRAERDSNHAQRGVITAFPDLIEILKSNNSNLLAGNPGIIHFFSGTENEAKELLGMGFYFTFGGAITYPPKKNGVDYEAIIKMMPMERILSETDAPYVAPVPYRGKRNEPIYVIETVKKLAAFKRVSLETMKTRILENAEVVFNLFELRNK